MLIASFNNMCLPGVIPRAFFFDTMAWHLQAARFLAESSNWIWSLKLVWHVCLKRQETDCRQVSIESLSRCLRGFPFHRRRVFESLSYRMLWYECMAHSNSQRVYIELKRRRWTCQCQPGLFRTPTIVRWYPKGAQTSYREVINSGFCLISLRPFVFVLICVNVWPFSREIFIRDSGSHKVMICYSHWFFLENNCGNTKSQISLDCSRIFLFRSTHFTFTFMTCVWRLLQEKVSCCSTHFWMWHLYVVVRRWSVRFSPLATECAH